MVAVTVAYYEKKIIMYKQNFCCHLVGEPSEPQGIFPLCNHISESLLGHLIQCSGLGSNLALVAPAACTCLLYVISFLVLFLLYGNSKRNIIFFNQNVSYKYCLEKL